MIHSKQKMFSFLSDESDVASKSNERMLLQNKTWFQIFSNFQTYL